MSTNEQIIENIDKVVSQDPANSNWIKLVLYPFILFGLLATAVSGYIEFKFFTSVFTDFYFWGILLVVAFEGSKIGAIIIYEYVKKHSEIKFSSGLTSIIWTLRITLIVFSTICSFSKISQFGDSPNYDSEALKAEQRINAQYDKIISTEDVNLKKSIEDAKKEMNAEEQVFKNGQWKGTHYDEKKTIWEKSKVDRDNVLLSLRSQRDSIITKTKKELTTDSKSKNQILVGVYNTFQNIGIKTEFNKFYSLFVLLIAAFTTIILELIIWAVFGIIGAIYEGVFKAKLDGYVEMQKELETTRVSNFKEEVKTFNFLRNIRRTFKKGFGKTKSFVDEVENENNS